MILRDRVTIRNGSGTIVATDVPAHVSHQSAVVPTGEGQIPWAVMEQATALLPPGTPWESGANPYRLTVAGETGGDYVADGPPMPRRRNGKVHHLTAPLRRYTS